MKAVENFVSAFKNEGNERRRGAKRNAETDRERERDQDPWAAQVVGWGTGETGHHEQCNFTSPGNTTCFTFVIVAAHPSVCVCVCMCVCVVSLSTDSRRVN